MDPSDALTDFQRRLRAVAVRRGCHEMVAWAHVRTHPDVLNASAGRVTRLRSRSRSRSMALPGSAGLDSALCVACDEPLEGHGDLFSFVPCGHAMHDACGRAMIESYLAQGKAMPFACPCVPGCRGVVDECPPVALRPTALPPCYAPCPGLDCSRFVLSFLDGVHAVRCAGCDTRFCHACRGGPHPRETPCAAVLGQAEVDERLGAAMRVLDAVPFNELCVQMAAHHLPTTYLPLFYRPPRWMAIERNLSDERQIAAHAAPPFPRVEAIREIKPSKELIARAREKLALPSTGAAPPPTVLDAAVASLALATHASGVEEHSKFCPKCFVRVVRLEGCPSMHCRCGHTFCYICLGPVHTHDTCSQAVNTAALRAAAELAGESAAVVDDLALFSDEAEHFAGNAETRALHMRAERDMRRQRLERLLPLLVATARLAALKEPGVVAPAGAIANARTDIILALEREEAIAERLGTHGLLPPSTLGVEAMAQSDDIVKYAKLRVTIAKERVRRSIVPAEALAASAWHADAHGRLLRARETFAHLDPCCWLLARCELPLHKKVVIDGVSFLATNERDKPFIVLRNERRGDATMLSKCVFSINPQVGQFTPGGWDAVGDAFATLVKRVLNAAEDAAMVAMHGPPALRPPIPPAPAASDVPSLGDLVVRGPNWIFHDQDGAPGNNGVVIAKNEMDMYNLRVKWLATDREYGYTVSATTKHVVSASHTAYTPASLVDIMHSAVRPFLPRLKAGDLLAYRNIMALLDARPPGRPVARRPTFEEIILTRPSAAAESRPPGPVGVRSSASVVRAIEAVCRTYHVDPPPPVDEGDAVTEWECPKCTLINTSLLSQCEVCEFKRPLATVAPPSAPTIYVHASPASGDAALARLLRAMRV